MEAVNRREIKFVFDGLRDYDLVSSVQLHPFGFAPEYPQRWVNNIYFDTHNLDTLGDHLAGIAARRKLRLRWYDATACEVTGGILQLKEKRGLLISKIVQPIDAKIDLQAKDWPDVQRILFEQASGSLLGQYLRYAFPVLIQRYKRRYYRAGDIRLTIDHDLMSIPQIGRKPIYGPGWMRTSAVVVELKIPAKMNSNRISDLLAYFGDARSQAFSKYRWGMLEE